MYYKIETIFILKDSSSWAVYEVLKKNSTPRQISESTL